MNQPTCCLDNCEADGDRWCSICNKYYCVGHICAHLSQIEPLQSSDGWLSTTNVVANMTDEQLMTARLRLAVQIQAIDREIGVRSFDKVRRTKRKAKISERDLQEERSFSSKSGAKGKAAGLLSKYIASLPPDQLAKLQEKLEAAKQKRS